MTQHLVMLPILLPMICGALLVPINERRRTLRFTLSMLSVLGMLAAAVALLLQADGPAWDSNITVYLAANWPAPFGIALVADRLAATMLVLTALLATASLLYAAAGWGRVGVHFLPLFQFLLMGINGAFLTHDLFNLFVFFEIMLASSYGLVLHGHGRERIRAGMQYIAVNLVVSLLFLIGVATIYGATGTLNMADLSHRLAGTALADDMLVKAGLVILAISFLVKSAAWPLGFWLPTTYTAATAPAAAMLVLMTKVGIYAILRVWLLAFPQTENGAAGFGYSSLLYLGLATIVFGAAGMLATDQPKRIAGWAALVSSGTLLAAIGSGEAALVPAALYYLISSTLAVAALMLLAELLDRIRSPRAAILALTSEAFAVEDLPQETAGTKVPVTLAVLGLAFAACGLIIAGLPPLSGFVAKFSLFHILIGGQSGVAPSTGAWSLVAALLASGLLTTISLMRAGVRIFWASGMAQAPRLSILDMGSIGLLLGACVSMAVFAGPTLAFLTRANDGLHKPENYQQRVLQTLPVQGVQQ